MSYYDESRQYEYSLVALKPTAATEIWLYRWSKEYKKTSRIDFLRAKKGYREMTYDNAQQTAVKGFVKKMKYDFKELDYR